MLGCDAPAAADADHCWAEIVDRKRDEPRGNAYAPVEEASQEDQGGAEHRGRRETEKCAESVGVIANDDRGEE